MKYLLDTNICIYAIRKRPEHIGRKLSAVSVRHELHISAITVAELEFGVHKSMDPQKNAVSLLRFLSPFDVRSFGEDATAYYGKLRADLEKRGQPIGGNDMLIAAQALAGGYTLVTNNVSEFSRVSGLKVENWVTEA